ncbi:helix-turn-helix domain-containing protein [Cohnella sp. LGH]|uniref:AraC family transcriptional regulator n=1 Tax=Cohnella sp. LGH TaxID=1619153 RepID=UPI001ADCA2A5|nr:AraC family transcriptional regulator [Cohnella sp. LGH]QTH42001.1 helix-turn-helix domain-containing protein [Cohnella sp. LGH]
MYQYKLSDNIDPQENINMFRYSTTSSDYEHTHEFFEIVFIASGSGVHNVGGVSYSVERGDVLFIDFDQTHAFSSDTQMTIVNCLLDPVFIGKELMNAENAIDILTLSAYVEFSTKVSRFVPKVIFRGKDLLKLDLLFESMLEEFEEKSIGYKTAIQGYLQVLLTYIFRKMREEGDERASLLPHKVASDMLQDLEASFFGKISLNELAAKYSYNASYLSRIFKACYGKSPMAFIHEKRMDEAIRLLRETDLTVEEIGRQVGYGEKKQFYKIFKQYTGLTPSKMRDARNKMTTIK